MTVRIGNNNRFISIKLVSWCCCRWCFHVVVCSFFNRCRIACFHLILIIKNIVMFVFCCFSSKWKHSIKRLHNNTKIHWIHPKMRYHVYKYRNTVERLSEQSILYFRNVLWTYIITCVMVLYWQNFFHLVKWLCDKSICDKTLKHSNQNGKHNNGYI